MSVNSFGRLFRFATWGESNGPAIGALVDGWRGSLLKGWTITSQLTTGSGLPLTPYYPTTAPGTGFTGSVRADPLNTVTRAAPAASTPGKASSRRSKSA